MVASREKEIYIKPRGIWNNTIDTRDMNAIGHSTECRNLIMFKDSLESRPCLSQLQNRYSEKLYAVLTIAVDMVDDFTITLFINNGSQGRAKVYNNGSLTDVTIYDSDGTTVLQNPDFGLLDAKPFYFKNPTDVQIGTTGSDVIASYIVLIFARNSAIYIGGQTYSIQVLTDRSVKIQRKIWTDVNIAGGGSPITITGALHGVQVGSGFVLGSPITSTIGASSFLRQGKALAFFNLNTAGVLEPIYATFPFGAPVFGMGESQQNFFVCTGNGESWIGQKSDSFNIRYIVSLVTRDYACPFAYMLQTLGISASIFDGVTLQKVTAFSREPFPDALPDYDILNSSGAYVRSLHGALYPKKKSMIVSRVDRVNGSLKHSMMSHTYDCDSWSYIDLLRSDIENPPSRQLYCFCSMQTTVGAPIGFFGGESTQHTDGTWTIGLYREASGSDNPIEHVWTSTRINTGDAKGAAIDINGFNITFCCLNYVAGTFKIQFIGYDYKLKKMVVSEIPTSSIDEATIPSEGIEASLTYNFNYSGWKDFQISIKCTARYFRLNSIVINPIIHNITGMS